MNGRPPGRPFCVGVVVWAMIPVDELETCPGPLSSHHEARKPHREQRPQHAKEASPVWSIEPWSITPGGNAESVATSLVRNGTPRAAQHPRSCSLRRVGRPVRRSSSGCRPHETPSGVSSPSFRNSEPQTNAKPQSKRQPQHGSSTALANPAQQSTAAIAPAAPQYFHVDPSACWRLLV